MLKIHYFDIHQFTSDRVVKSRKMAIPMTNEITSVQLLHNHSIFCTVIVQELFGRMPFSF